MWGIIISAIVNLLEKAGWRWWMTHKIEEANEAKNKAESLSDVAAVDELHTKWTRD